MQTSWSSLFYFPKLGVADGSVLVFDVPSRGTGVKLQETLSAHVASISDIHASGNVMVSADESGKLVTWKSGGHFTKLQVIEGAGWVKPRLNIAKWLLLWQPDTFTFRGTKDLGVELLLLFYNYRKYSFIYYCLRQIFSVSLEKNWLPNIS